jgi:hypothetical protein
MMMTAGRGAGRCVLDDDPIEDESSDLSASVNEGEGHRPRVDASSAPIAFTMEGSAHRALRTHRTYVRLLVVQCGQPIGP